MRRDCAVRAGSRRPARPISACSRSSPTCPTAGSTWGCSSASRARSMNRSIPTSAPSTSVSRGRRKRISTARSSCPIISTGRPRRRAELRAALARNPEYVPALLNLGNLLEDLGRREEASKAYARALEIEPENSLALARLATVSLPANPDPLVKDRLDAAIANPRTPPAEAADLGFALGALLDAAGDHDQAFDAYLQANRASRAAAGHSRDL